MKKIIPLLVMLCFLFIGSATAANQGKFIVILLDQLSLKEIASGGGNELNQYFNEGAAALLNVRTDKGIETAYTYAAFGAGSRGEKYGAIPGLLGQLMRENDYTIATFGNSDYGTEERREVVTIVSDDNGHLFFGDISDAVLLHDPSFPGGVRTYYHQMIRDFDEAYGQYDLIFLEIGDIARIKTGLTRGELTVEQADSLLRVTMLRLDALLKYVLQTVDKTDDTVMLVAPTPDPREAQKGEKLSWVLLMGRGIERGFLTTGTTRRPGLATISDLAPTILTHFEISIPVVINGQKLHSKAKSKNDMASLLRFSTQIHRTSEWRPWYIKGFILIQIIVIALLIFIYFTRRIMPCWGWRKIRVILLSIMVIPLAFLLFSPYWVGNFYSYLAIFLCLIVVVAGFLERICENHLLSVTSIVALMCFLLFIDIFRNSPWMASSLLGYCPVIGARFYGIGNEYMGILVGGTLISWTALLDSSVWLQKRKLILTPMIFITIMLIIGAPFFGANFGGILTAMAAFSLTYVLMFEKSQRRRMILLSMVVIFAVLSIILLVDTYGWTGEQSHLGRTINLLKEQGIASLINIIWRKLSMNLKLLRWTIWTRVLLSFIIVLALLFKRPRGIMYELVQLYPNLSLGFVGVLFGSVVTMAVNDSGVVAAATLLFFAIFTLLYLVICQIEQNGNLTSVKKKI